MAKRTGLIASLTSFLRRPLTGPDVGTDHDGRDAGAQPWRRHPRLAGRFHPDFPDDLQIVVHDGGPRLSDRPPELVWARVDEGDGGDLFWGRVLNAPHGLASVAEGDRVRFVVPESGDHPLMVRPEYLAERGDWVIEPCSGCGVSELLDAPSDLVAATFPDLPPGQSPEMFTAFCGLCGGVQVIERRHAPADDAALDPNA